MVNDPRSLTRQKADQLLTLADHLGLVQQPAPRPLPQIEPDDIHLICWTVILPAPLTAGDSSSDQIMLDGGE